MEVHVLRQVQRYTDEPPAHTSDEEADVEEDQDGLSPAELRARMERKVQYRSQMVSFLFYFPEEPKFESA